MNFYGLSFGKFRFGVAGNDTYTSDFNLFTALYRTFSNVGNKEENISISGNEFNLYKTTPELFLTVNKKASMFSNGVFKIKDWKTGNEIENDPLLKLLENPSPLFNRNLWLMQVCIDMEILGNHLTYLKRNSENLTLFPNPDGLIPLPADKVKIKKTGKQFEALKIEEIIEAYKFDDINATYLPNQIFHLKRQGDDGVIGNSPLHAIKMPIANIRGAYGFRNLNIAKRGGLGLISPAKMSDAFGGNIMTPEQRSEIEKEFTKSHGYGDNQTSYRMSPIPVDYNHLAYPIKDQMLFEEVNEDWQKIIDSVGLNRNIFSFKDGAKYSNLVEGLRMTYQDTIIPFAELFCFELTKALKLQGKYIELDYSHIPALSENEREKAMVNKMKAESLKILIENGLTLEEARAVINI